MGETGRRNLTGAMLHSADISNPLVPKFEVCRKWAESITEEFVNQYKREIELSLPPTQMWATVDKPLGFYKSQGGFINFMVAPLWTMIFDFFPDILVRISSAMHWRTTRRNGRVSLRRRKRRNNKAIVVDWASRLGLRVV